MQPPELPPGVTVPDLYQLSDKMSRRSQEHVVCPECQHVTNSTDMRAFDMATFLMRIAEFYDQRR